MQDLIIRWPNGSEPSRHCESCNRLGSICLNCLKIISEYIML